MSVPFASAQDQSSIWTIEPQLYVTGVSQFIKKRGYSDSQQSVLAAAEIKLRSESRTWSTSLFAEYRFRGSDQDDDILNLGGFVKNQLGNWDTAAYLFIQKGPGQSENWIYAGRLRYRLRENHRVGIQAAGIMDAAISPPVALGYYGSINDSLSLNFIADPGINGATDFAARMELVWQLR